MYYIDNSWRIIPISTSTAFIATGRCTLTDMSASSVSISECLGAYLPSASLVTAPVGAYCMTASLALPLLLRYHITYAINDKRLAYLSTSHKRSSTTKRFSATIYYARDKPL